MGNRQKHANGKICPGISRRRFNSYKRGGGEHNKMIMNPPLTFQNFTALGSNSNIQTPADGTSYTEIEGHTGAARVPLVRFQNDAVPRFEVLNGLYITPTGAVSTIEGALYYDSGAHKLKVRVAAGWETITSA